MPGNPQTEDTQQLPGPPRRHRRLGAYRRDPPLPAVFTRAQARHAGLSDRQIDHRLAVGVWVAERRGVLRVSDSPNGSAGAIGPAGAPSTNPAAVLLDAVLIAPPGRDLVVSHASAAMLHGLPRPLPGWGRPTLTTNRGFARVRNAAHVLVAPLTPEEVTRADGVPVTTLARTVADCLRHLSGADGLAIADAAARRGLPVSRLRAALENQAGWPGVVQARELCELIDGRRESPLESWSALAFHHWSVPAPRWQVVVRAADGEFCGRVDAWWPAGLAGEADGRAKYALQAAERAGAGTEPGGMDADALLDALQRERGREQSLRRAGAEVVRWGSRDVLSDQAAGELARHVRRQLARLARAPCFTGTATPQRAPASPAR